MNSRLLALLSAGGATMIYGLNHTIAKEVMPDHVGAFGFIFIRTAGATILFWFASLFVPFEKIEKKDYLKFFFTALGWLIEVLKVIIVTQMHSNMPNRIVTHVFMYLKNFSVPNYL